MRHLWLALVASTCFAPAAQAFIEAPHSLGRICKESTTIVVVEVARVDRTKNLIIYRKVRELKGKHPQDQIRHNVGQRGSHPREWKTVMAWAKEGKRAVFFHNGAASVTGIDDYWYQCFPEGQWWAMSHAEPFLLRTYYGSAARLEAAVTDILAGKEVVVPAMVDGPKEQFHERTGKVHRIRASAKLLDYDPKRDFVAAGKGEEPAAARSAPATPAAPAVAGGSKAVAEDTPSPQRRFYRAINLNGPALEIDGRRWEADTARAVKVTGQRFDGRKVALRPPPDEAKAKMIRTCVWGKGCGVTLTSVPAGEYEVFLYVWEDNAAQTFDVKVNGKVVQAGVNSGHAGQWKRLGPWAVNVTDGAISVANGSSTDANFSGIEVYRVDRTPVPEAASEAMARLTVDRAARSVTVPCLVAPRKLPHLDEVYPIEVIATWPSPHGQKAHETVVTFAGIRPSEVHAALEEVGLKPGKPARGESGSATGPAVKLYLEIPAADGEGTARRIPVEQALIDRRTKEPLKRLRWHFTGSVLRQIDPESEHRSYGADVTGTLIALFPVTDDVVIQSGLSMKDEPGLKLEVNRKALPAEGKPVKLVIVAAGE